jgi:hypothetical protein
MDYLKYIVFIISIFFLRNNVFCDNINKIFSSPNNINKIEYEGMDRRGVGTFYNNYKHNINKILTIELGAIGPQINWYGDYIAEIYNYLGTNFHRSYFYLYKYNKLTPPINQVIYVIPDMEIIFDCNDWVHINIRSLVSSKILQTIEFEGINGNFLGSRNLFNNVEITKDEILIWIDIEPYTYKILENPILYRFKRMF